MAQQASTLDRPRPAVRSRPRVDVPRIVMHGILTLVSLAFVMPLLIIVSASFSSESAISANGYSVLPRQFSTFAYRYVLDDPSAILRAYGVSILVTTVGTVASLAVMSMLAFSLAQRSYRLRRPLSFYVLFTMIFSGGLVPGYILITQYLHLQNTLLVLILPYLVSPWFVLLLRTFFSQLPDEILDAARVDGAGDWRLFTRIVLPLSKPALATVGLFVALVYWNDWWLGLLYITNDKLIPVQLFLYRILTNIDFVTSQSQFAGQSLDVPIQTLRAAIAVLAIGPIVVAFFFVQRFLIRGITVGGVKD
ncbi:putative aldouronate transport system permease protein [Kribbella aluminosa]|uniref:Aldouronate transport system permease protein n=1 Tax=Kribbella aluminosa TaxID=416017 RepID=A0ABS4UJW2_9ACTN|nr:carbohydrate ABC transporter permease [Kribbella aluminosa]MBP2351900.1 putative aldouronate transport system permease protein [Kribbella aluminosa]